MAIEKLKSASALEALTSGFANNAKVSASRTGDSFSSALDKAGEKLQANVGESKGGTASKTQVKTSVETTRDSNMGQRENAQSTKIQDAMEKAGLSEGSTMKDPVTEAVEKIAQEIKDELGITDEQLEEAMETLGIAMIDLLKPESITAIVSEITGTDAADILTSEELTTSVMNILSTQREAVGDLMQEIDVTPEEFKELVDTGEIVNLTENTAANAAGEEIQTADTSAQVETEEIQVTVTDTTVEEKAVEQDTVVTDENKETAGTTSETVTASNSTVKTDGQPETVAEESETAETGNTSEADKTILTATNSKITAEDTADEESEGSNAGRHVFDDRGEIKTAPETHKESSSNNTIPTFQQNLTDAVIDAAGVEEAQSAQTMTTAQRVADILDQIQNQIKISVDQETTSMELQLNPASLGKVALHIESKAGVVSAQFEAQNATVKEAIEAQITQLRETLETKGIKVNEVEVTVSSHAFEQNLMNGQSGGQSLGGNSEGSERSARLRRINLNSAGTAGAAEEAEAEDDASVLARKMMIDSGNSVDFTA
ncbi:MAG: flagellar hook-length control protein FliK [Lachnospiraceae bacterium]|nr:flagellar hook-length control protein FliK [Lachnospiraceae bacterium]